MGKEFGDNPALQRVWVAFCYKPEMLEKYEKDLEVVKNLVLSN